MPNRGDRLEYIQKEGLVLLKVSALPMEYEELEKLLKSSHPLMKIVSREFWEFQLKYIAGSTAKILAGHRSIRGVLQWEGLKEITQFAELKMMFILSKINRSMLDGEDGHVENCPPTAFYRRDDLICTVQISLKENQVPIPYDKKKVSLVIKEDQYIYTSLDYGYLDFSAGRMTLMPAITVEGDNTRLYLHHFPLDSSSQWKLEDYVEQQIMNRRHDFPKAKNQVEKILQLTPVFKRRGYSRVLLCDGVEPTAGKNGHLEMKVFPESPPQGEEMDFHEFKQYITVEKGELIAIKHPPKPGIPGLDIEGREIYVDDVEDILIRLEGPLGVKEETDGIHYYAQEQGLVHHGEDFLMLEEVFVVHSNVDYSTGNIEYEKSVEVRGDVKSGFSVKSMGRVIIRGCVENGAFVESREGTLVVRGLIGEDSYLRSKGNVILAYCQDGTIMAEGDIEVEKNVLRGRLSCSGNIRVHGRGVNTSTKGAIFGGQYSAMKGMEYQSMGGEAKKSEFTLGYDVQATLQKQDKEQELAVYTRQLFTAVQRMPADLTSPEGKARLARLTPSQKQRLKENLLALKSLTQITDQLQVQIKELESREFCKEGENPRIRIFQGLFGKNRITLGKITREFYFQNRHALEIVQDGDDLKIQSFY